MPNSPAQSVSERFEGFGGSKHVRQISPVDCTLFHFKVNKWDNGRLQRGKTLMCLFSVIDHLLDVKFTKRGQMEVVG